MCLHPILIDNPYYKHVGDFKLKVSKRDLSGRLVFDDSGKQVFHEYKGKWHKSNIYHNTLTAKIEVPCGQCSQCISNRQNFVLQRVQMESLRSHLFLLTLTYNDRNLMHTNVGEYQVAYPYFKDWQNMCKNMRDDGFKFRYFVVSEYGSSEFTARPHFHAIIAIEKTANESDLSYEARTLEFKYGKAFLKYWRRNYGSKRSPIYDNLLDLKYSRDGRCTYDFHYLVPLPGHDNDCAFYVSKYLWKYNERIVNLCHKIRLDVNLEDKDKISLTNKIKPRSTMSKDFGSYKLPEVQSYIDKCLSSNFEIAQFSDLFTGKTSMLSRYYRDHLVTEEWLSEHQNFSDYPDIGFMKHDDNSLLEYTADVVKDFSSDEHGQRVKDLLYQKY